MQRRLKRAAGILFALALPWLVSSCGLLDRPLPNVIIVVFDTVRADHMSAYGYPRETSPRFDAFARGATLFRTCRSTAPWTVPAHASLFTGLFPFEHGAVSYLAEALSAQGYRTAGFAANEVYLGRWTGLDQGFQTFDVRYERARDLNQRIFRWLRVHGEKPFLLFVNYMDAHYPYNTSLDVGFLPEGASDDPTLLDSLALRVLPGRGPIPQDLRRRTIDQYDTAIAADDAALGELLEELSRLEELENSVVVVTSDHGEYFGSHHLVAHSKDIYEPVLVVPLAIKAPGQERGRAWESPVSLVDVANLIAQRIPGRTGRCLAETFPREPGGHPMVSESYYARTKDLLNPVWGKRFRRVRRAIYDPPYKYISSSDDRNELYDLQADVTESRNLLQTEPDVARRLASELKAFKSTPQTPAVGDSSVLDARQRELLETLGYTD